MGAQYRSQEMLDGCATVLCLEHWYTEFKYVATIFWHRGEKGYEWVDEFATFG